MNRRYRKTIIAGNWKMNKTPAETRAYIDELKALISRTKWCDIVLCVPAVDLSSAVKAAKGSRIAIGAQNVHQEASGAYTGECSADMLAAVGAKYVIIGHSERRAYFGETDELIARKLKAALGAGLRPILCVGETLSQREQGVTIEHIRMQLKIALHDVPAALVKKVVVAYEPIWAIGTGRTASPEQAGEVGAAIRSTLRELYDARVARSVTIQYGGSMTPKNARELLSQLDVDGGLVGGASLRPADFFEILSAANQ